MDTAKEPSAWWARGLLFENCNCQLVCPGHMHFEQLCTHERCRGYWAIRFDEGAYGSVPLAGVKAVIAFESPRRMIDGNWIQVVIIDQTASGSQREAVERILTGEAGGPWQTLGRFVGRRLETKFAPIEMIDEGATKRVTIARLLEGVVTQIRGRDRSRPVMFENIFNQIHAPQQVLATGTTQYDDGQIVIRNERTHGLFSNFEWSVATSGNRPS